MSAKHYTFSTPLIFRVSGPKSQIAEVLVGKSGHFSCLNSNSILNESMYQTFSNFAKIPQSNLNLLKAYY